MNKLGQILQEKYNFNANLTPDKSRLIVTLQLICSINLSWSIQSVLRNIYMLLAFKYNFGEVE